MEMTTLEQLEELFVTYDQQAKTAREKSSYFATVLGIGNDYRSHPCHDQFYEAVGQCLAQFLEQEPDAQAVAPVLQWLLQIASQHKDEPTYWYLYAMHGYAGGLIERAEPTLCAQLHAWYNQAYPRIERMPVQNTIYKALGKRGKKG